MRGAPGLTAMVSFALPTALVVLLAGLGSFVLRARQGDRRRAARDTSIDVAMALWIVVILAVTVVPLRASGSRPPIGMIPFADALARIASGQASAAAEMTDWVDNVILFLPLGILAGLRWGRGWWLVAILLAISLSTAIELTQAIERAGRFASATDVVTNTLGAAVGFGIGLRIRRPGPSTSEDDRAGTKRPV